MRPANTFVTEMSKFSSEVDIVFGGKRINGKSIMNIMAGCIKCGSEITVECSGADENEMLKKSRRAYHIGLRRRIILPRLNERVGLMLKGIGASQGFGIGKAVVIRDTNLDYSSVKFTDSDHQKKRLHSAVADFSDETKSLVAELKKNAGNKEAEILEGHLVMLEDPFMLAQMEEAIDNGSVAEAAVDSICTMFINMFSGVDDELTRQRASDVKDIRDSLLRILLGVKSVDISSVPKGSVLIAKDFTPSMTSQINRENVSAIITEVGGVTSHSAILARAMGIPAVLSVVNAVEKISDGDMIIADGFKGKVFTDPTEEELEEYRTKQAAYLKEKESLNEYFSKETVTKSGVKNMCTATSARLRTHRTYCKTAARA